METKIDYWKEKELELAMNILPQALGWTDRAATFNPVSFSLEMAETLVNEFRLKHGLL